MNLYDDPIPWAVYSLPLLWMKFLIWNMISYLFHNSNQLKPTSANRPVKDFLVFLFQTCTQPAPLSTDHFAQAERDRIDYSIKITKEVAASGEGMDGMWSPLKIFLCNQLPYSLHTDQGRQIYVEKNYPCFPKSHRKGVV